MMMLLGCRVREAFSVTRRAALSRLGSKPITPFACPAMSYHHTGNQDESPVRTTVVLKLYNIHMPSPEVVSLGEACTPLRRSLCTPTQP